MTSRPFRFRWRTQTFRANLLDSLCDVLHTYGLDFGLHLRHLRDEYTRKEVGDYYAAMCPISHNILLRLEAVVNRWTKRVTRGLIGRVRSANITQIREYKCMNYEKHQHTANVTECTLYDATIRDRCVALVIFVLKQAWSAVTWPIAKRSCQVTGDQLFG